MPLVESLILPRNAGTSSEPAVSSDRDSTPPSNPVFRGVAYAFAFEAMAAMTCYSVWLIIGAFRRH